MTVKARIEAMGISPPTYYKWKTTRDDFPSDDSTVKEFVRYALNIKEKGHDNPNKIDKSEGSIHYQQEILKLEKQRVDIDHKMLQLERGKSEILEENFYEIIEELDPFLKNLKSYIKANEVYDGSELQSLIDKALVKTEEQLLARAEQSKKEDIKEN